jgi:Zn-dependent protease
MSSMEEHPEPLRDYEPLHPSGGVNWKRLLERIWAPIAAVIGVAVKFGFLFVKFFGLFISVGAYALIWGWRFGVGIVVLIAVHELGHYVEARRQGLDASLPTFVPFLGAFVLIKNSPVNPWRNALVSLAGPAAGGIGAAVCLALGEATNSNLLRALAYFAFMLNLINLLPIGILDGGTIWRSIALARRVPAATPEYAFAAPYGTIPGGGRARAMEITILYVALAALLVVGMVVAHVPQHRL